MRFLVTWKLVLKPEALRTISNQPEFFKKALDGGLNYVKSLAKDGKIIALYRVLPAETPIQVPTKVPTVAKKV